MKRARWTDALPALFLAACAAANAPPADPSVAPTASANATSAASAPSPSASSAPPASAASAAAADVCERASVGCFHYDVAACKKAVERRTRGPRDCDGAIRAWADCGKLAMQFACDIGDLPPIGCGSEAQRMETCLSTGRAAP